MQCEFCHTDGQPGTICSKCGAKIPEKKQDNFIKSEPFFYNGYLVVYIKNYTVAKNEFEIQFWLGKELQQRFCVSSLWYEQNIPEGCDPLPFFWDLFLLAKGEKEVIYWQNKNEKPYIMYEIRRIDTRESYIKS